MDARPGRSGPPAREGPFVAEVLALEHALLRAVLFAEGDEVARSVAPDVVLGALAAGRWPVDVPVADTVVRVAV